MKLAVVAPSRYHRVIRELGLGYHLVEVTQFLTRPNYAFGYQSFATRGHFIMLDNGAAEVTSIKHGRVQEDGGVIHHREPLAFQEVLKVAEVLRADEVMLPDRKMDADWTIEHTLQWIEAVPVGRRAVVPQGTDHIEWKACLLQLMAKKDFATICITKDFEEFGGGRAKLLQWLEDNGYHLRYHVHLLGVKAVDQGPLEEISSLSHRYPWVRGLDTGAPIAWAQHDCSIVEHRTRFSLDWDSTFGSDELVSQNIRAIQAAALGGDLCI